MAPAVVGPRARNRALLARQGLLDGGAVAGTWRHERGRIVSKPFGRPTQPARAGLDAEAERPAALHA